MSENKHMPTRDERINELLAATSVEHPDSALDDAILQHARKVATTDARRAHLRPWQVVLPVAAVLVLSVSIVLFHDPQTLPIPQPQPQPKQERRTGSPRFEWYSDPMLAEPATIRNDAGVLPSTAPAGAADAQRATGFEFKSVSPPVRRPAISAEMSAEPQVPRPPAVDRDLPAARNQLDQFPSSGAASPTDEALYYRPAEDLEKGPEAPSTVGTATTVDGALDDTLQLISSLWRQGQKDAARARLDQFRQLHPDIELGPFLDSLPGYYRTPAAPTRPPTEPPR